MNIINPAMISPRPNPEQVFRSLEGVWGFTRVIHGSGRMKGTATFVKKADSTLLYYETGLLKLNDGASFESYRNYIYEWNDQKITVLFEDGRFFHELDFETDMDAKGHHECGLDLYRASYRFDGPHSFELQWAVTGPKKDYIIQTNFEKRVTC